MSDQPRRRLYVAIVNVEKAPGVVANFVVTTLVGGKREAIGVAMDAASRRFPGKAIVGSGAWPVLDEVVRAAAKILEAKHV